MDIDADGQGVVSEQRLDQLIRHAGPIRDWTSETASSTAEIGVDR